MSGYSFLPLLIIFVYYGIKVRCASISYQHDDQGFRKILQFKELKENEKNLSSFGDNVREQKKHVTQKQSESDYLNFQGMQNVYYKTAEIIRDPYKALEESVQHSQNDLTKPKNITKPTSAILKRLLKNTDEILSLSEILQQNNLSLSDLLAGNEDAINFLHKKFAESEKINSTTLLNENEIQHEGDLKTFDISLNEDNATKNSNSSKPSTIEQLNIKTNVSVQNIYRNEKVKLPAKSESLKMELSSHTLATSKSYYNYVAQPIMESTKSLSNDHGNYLAKNEIEESLKDPLFKQKLIKILEVRKMTLQELIKQRERGYHQNHLTEIFSKFHRPRSYAKSMDGFLGDLTDKNSTAPLRTALKNNLPTNRPIGDKPKKEYSQPRTENKDVDEDYIKFNSIDTDIVSHVPMVENTRINGDTIDGKYNKKLDLTLYETESELTENPKVQTLGPKSAIIGSFMTVCIFFFAFVVLLFYLKHSQKQRHRILYNRKYPIKNKPVH